MLTDNTWLSLFGTQAANSLTPSNWHAAGHRPRAHLLQCAGAPDAPALPGLAAVVTPARGIRGPVAGT